MPAATALALALCGAGRAAAANFPINYSPTGIAYDSVSNLVLVSSGNQVNTYTTSGASLYSFIPTTGIFDLGAGASGTMWIANGTSCQNRDFVGNGITSTSLPAGTVALGRELWVGGTNWLLYAVSGGNVVAKNLADQSTRVLFATPANTRGGDWILRPGGYALEHVLVGFCGSSQANSYYPNGTLYQSVSLDTSFGNGQDMAYGDQVIWTAQGGARNGNVLDYPFTLPPVPEAAVAVSASNGWVRVTWTGWALETSADLLAWTALTNAASPSLFAPTNTAQFFRTVK